MRRYEDWTTDEIDALREALRTLLKAKGSNDTATVLDLLEWANREMTVRQPPQSNTLDDYQ